MSVEVKVPLLSESVAEATLLKWRKKEGDHVDRDENVVDIETDKVVLELPAPAAGVLVKIMKGDGSDRDKWRGHCLDRYRDPRRNRNAACRTPDGTRRSGKCATSQEAGIMARAPVSTQANTRSTSQRASPADDARGAQRRRSGKA